MSLSLLQRTKLAHRFKGGISSDVKWEYNSGGSGNPFSYRTFNKDIVNLDVAHILCSLWCDLSCEG